MSEYKLSTEIRTQFRKSDTKELRRKGKIPAVYYFHKTKPIPLIIDMKELKEAIHSDSHIINLQIGKKSHPCILRDIQHDPVSELITHADFMGVNLEEKISVNIPIIIVGTAIGVKTFVGVLTQHLWEIEAKCKATNIPDGVTIDVSNLNLGDSISIKDISLENVEILNSPTTSIVSVVKPSGAAAEEEKPEEAAVEEEEGQEEETKKE